ncbi:MAG: PorP/SprF family type IX secretion system membrane protein [Chitinophagales bacterium]|nr:PorP/SprF family type IX secretion system membrane protein [Chitinophagales bacterium]HNL06406.1 PorP/SprF family type IX secretion system membrane protein [Chitinophagales bacterium]
MKHYCQMLVSFVAFWCVISTTVWAQDIHYTQFYADVLRLNPANTGNFGADYRFGANARTQWNAVPVPYQTLSAYADLAWLRNRRTATSNWIGSGIRLLADQAGTGRLSTYEAAASAAGHLNLGNVGYLSLGANLTFVQKQVDFGRLYFSSQWNEVDFDPDKSSQENIIGNRLSYIDIGTGMVANVRIADNILWHLGAAGLHVNRPKISFLNGSENRLGTRLLFHTSGTIVLNNWSIEPATYYTTQKKAAEWVIGSNVGIKIGDSGSLHKPQPIKTYFGLWYRHKDAIAPLVGMEMADYRFLLSYDVNISSLADATRGRGGLEISLVHVGTFNKLTNSTIYCPRF